MKRCVFALLALLSTSAFGQTSAVNGYCEQGAKSATVQGLNSTNKLQGIIPGCTVTVYYTGTSTQVPGSSIFADSIGTVLGNPFTANTTTGQYLFYAANGVGLDVARSSGTTQTDVIPGGGSGGGGGVSPGTAGQVAVYPSSGSTVSGETISCQSGYVLQGVSSTGQVCVPNGSSGGGGTSGQALAPLFSIATGYVGTSVQLTVTDGTPGATILLGFAQPPANCVPNVPYTTAITVGASGTLCAQATATGLTASAISYWQGTITSSPTPAFTPTSPYSGPPQLVTLTSSSPTMYYCVDSTNQCTPMTLYTTPISISTLGQNYIRAYSTSASVPQSPVAVWDGFIFNTQVPAPQFNPGGGIYNTSPQAVAVTDFTAASVPSAAIYYTLDGSTPTCSSTPVGGGAAGCFVIINSTSTLKAITCATGYTNSTVTSATFTISATGQTATPTFSPAPGNYPSPQTVTISDTTPGAVIYWQIQGQRVPTLACGGGTLYTGPLSFSSLQFPLVAIACAPPLADSAIASAGIGLILPSLVFTPPSPYTGPAASVTITDPAGGNITYGTATTGTCNPFANAYTVPINFTASETICAVALHGLQPFATLGPVTTWIGTTGGAGGSPGGVNGNIQYNNSGSFGGYTSAQALSYIGGQPVSITGTSNPPSLPCSFAVNNLVYAASTTNLYYQCSNTTGSYLWNPLNNAAIFVAGNDLSGTNTAQNVVGIQNHPLASPTSAGYLYWNGSAWTYQNPAGAGTVTSVGFTGGLVSIATPTTTPAFTVAGTSGGHPYFNSATSWASTGAGTAHGLWLAEGAGNADVTTGAGTAGQALVSGGTSADPTYQTLGIGGGGTGATTAPGAVTNLGAASLTANQTITGQQKIQGHSSIGGTGASPNMTYPVQGDLSFAPPNSLLSLYDTNATIAGENGLLTEIDWSPVGAGSNTYIPMTFGSETLINEDSVTGTPMITATNWMDSEDVSHTVNLGQLITLEMQGGNEFNAPLGSINVLEMQDYNNGTGAMTNLNNIFAVTSRNAGTVTNAIDILASTFTGFNAGGTITNLVGVASGDAGGGQANGSNTGTITNWYDFESGGGLNTGSGTIGKEVALEIVNPPNRTGITSSYAIESSRADQSYFAGPLNAQGFEVGSETSPTVVIPSTATGNTGNATGKVELVLSGTTGTITGTSLSATCDSGTATVTNAVVGHPVAVSSTTGADVGGAFNLRASVTSAGTVTVYVCGTGTPASLAYNVTVF